MDPRQAARAGEGALAAASRTADSAAPSIAQAADQASGDRVAPARKPAPAPRSASPAQVQPPTAAILPFVPLRKAEDAWIGSYLQEAVRRRIRASGKIGLLSRDAAEQRAALLGLEPLGAPSPAQWSDLGLDYVVTGTVQRVLDRVAVNVRVLGRDGDLLLPAPFSVMLDLKAEPPAAAIAPLLAQVAGALKLPAAVPDKAQPAEKWSAVEAVYRTSAEAERASDPEARTRLIGALEPYAKEPGVAGLALATEARLRLELALLTLTGDEQMRELGRAAQAAQRALATDSDDSERRALLAEIQFFLKQDYPARSEASVARLKNPLDGLAWVVLSLVAGPSTGEGTEHLKRARQANPFLWQSARAPGTPRFQGGVLEPILSHWAAQRAAGATARNGSDRLTRTESQAMREGIAAFEARRWDLAEPAFRKAGEQDEYDYRPVLYQLRILIETGRSAEAVAPLRDLAAENPLEPEVQIFLGVALEKSAALDEARQAFQRVLQDDSQQPLALLHLGTTDNALRAWAEAQDALRTLVAIQPRNEEAWLQLGIAQANLEEWAGADESFRQVQAINPKSPAAREWRARIRPKLTR